MAQEVSYAMETYSNCNLPLVCRHILGNCVEGKGAGKVVEREGEGCLGYESR